MRILLVNGPNINMLGRRDPCFVWDSTTLAEIEAAAAARGAEMGAEVVCFQSNHEGAIIDFLQAEGSGSDGIILNGGALSHYGLSLRDALVDTGLPVVEVHLSNIHARERWRSRSVTAEVAKGSIAGLGWRGYLYAVDYLVEMLKEEGGG